MITFSTFLFSAIFSPPGVYYFTFYSSSREGRRQVVDDPLELLRAAAAAVDRQPVLLPAVDGVAELEEGEDDRRDRHPEGDEAEDQDRREDRIRGEAEEDEGADHPRVDRPHPRRREREEVGNHAEEEALNDDRERNVDAEGVERSPEHADAEGPEASGAEHRQAAALGVSEEAEREAEAFAQGGGDLAGGLEEVLRALAVGIAGKTLLGVGRDQGDQ